MYYNFPKPFIVGIDTAKFNKVYARQRNSLWCWAACLEMVMKHNGIDISQREFAKLTCGVNLQGIPQNCPGTFDIITEYLNTCWRDNSAKYCLEADLNYNAPNLFQLYQELLNDNPVIVAYKNPNSPIGHAVLITGIEGYFLEDSIHVTKFILRDPWPTFANSLRNGRVVVTKARDFVNRISAHWFTNLYAYETNESVWL